MLTIVSGRDLMPVGKVVPACNGWTTVVVGACYDDDGGSISGAAYVFVRTGAAWGEEAKLTASDAAESDFFGYAVAEAGEHKEGFLTKMREIGHLRDRAEELEEYKRNAAAEVFSTEGDGSAIYTVDSLTAVATELISDLDPAWSNYQGNSLTFGVGGTLYGSSNGMLYTIDTTTGAGTQIAEQTLIGFGALADPDRYYLVSMATLSDGTIYGQLKETSSSSTTPSWLVRM